MPKLSSHITELGPHYEIIVVGSGYGGAIAASRLARAGREVCLLERGRERWPGEYPDTSWEATRDLQVHLPGGHHGNPTGLFDFRAGDVSAVVGCGLGGTSLINANVSKEPDDRLWAEGCWPPALVADRDGLTKAYDRARKMLRPIESPGHPTRKLAALHHAALGAGMGERYGVAPINVVFQDGVNAAGVFQKKCTMCGDCVTGCNVGAKTTTLMTYLPDAWRHGAKIFTEVGVRYLSHDDEHDQWVVHFDLLGVGRERFKHDHEMFVCADRVVLGAGTYGSTEILLRSRRDGGLVLSKKLGSCYSGNGDVLAFAYDCDEEINGVGFGDRTPPPDPDRHPHARAIPLEPVGPCIQGIVDRRDTPNLRDGHVVEEGAIPGAMGVGMPEALTAFTLFHVDRAPGDRHHDLRGALDATKSILGGPRRGAVAKTLTYLVQGHDGANGVLELGADDQLDLNWHNPGDQPTFDQAQELLEQLTKPLHGLYARDPLWGKLEHWRLITAHPLGGCPMGATAATGVVDDSCRVFTGGNDTDVYDSLYVMDGAVMPTSLGVNPSFTIAAFAERACEKLCVEQGWPFDGTTEEPQFQLPEFQLPSASAVMVRFTETMHGKITTNGAESDISFLVTIEIANVNALEQNTAITNDLVGTVSAPALDKRHLTIRGGTFKLFVNVDQVDRQEMQYRLPLVNQEENRYWLFVGKKTIADHTAVRAWHDTTTLKVDLYNSDESGNPIGDSIGSGTMKLDALDFAHQMRTMEVIGAKDTKQRLATLAKFGEIFGRELFERYGSVAAPESIFDPKQPPRKRRALNAPVRVIYDLRTDDGVVLRLTRFKGGECGPVLLAHGLGVSSDIFSTDLIDTNLVEYLTSHGYDVWLLDLRVSTALASSEDQSTADQIARFDHPAAVKFILEETGKHSLQALVHCYGSNTFVMSMLGGWIDKTQVRSVVCSQVATHLKTGLLARFEGGLHLPGLLHALGVKSLTAYVDKNGDDWKNRLFDDALRLEYVPPGEHCRSTVCHRITFIYGLLYQHDKLNLALHDNLHELFGIANITSLEQLAAMVRKGHLVDEHGDDVYLKPRNLERLKLPMRFISGSKNHCYKPVSTQETLEMLAAKNGAELYDRVVIDGYGHLDSIFGTRAADDVYPKILEHLDKTANPDDGSPRRLLPDPRVPAT
jgi:cholesterol oxidase